MSKELFWLDKSCPVCEQGRLFIIEDVTNQRLFLHCEECETAWLKPEDLPEADKGFLAINPDFETRMPSANTIQNWAGQNTN